ncbi:MAG: DNA-protecting protein DprA [Bacteroidales bacterium]|nr:DNA-protecting protein DprA [Bacteroidales bacterium]
MEYDELVYACAINRIFNYSCSKARLLVSRFPFPSDVFRLNRRELVEIFGQGSHFADDILNPVNLDLGQKDVEWALSNGVRIYYIGDADYPRRLKECADAPVILYFRGSCNLNCGRVVSFVGSRKATQYGLDMCRQLVESLSELSEPPLIVSGLAYGIDIAAHKAAIELGLETVGVMATGLDKVYPHLHRNIARQMEQRGGVVSDFPIKTPSVAINFIRRNRIIAGLSDATVLVESRADGGGVITSKMARSYDREVFAVPGRIGDELSLGCNQLIRENCAEMVTDRNSVRSSLGWKNLIKDGGIRAKFLTFESDNVCKLKIIALLYKETKATIDDLMDKTECDRGDLVLNLTELELEGRVESDLIGRYMLKR